MGGEWGPPAAAVHAVVSGDLLLQWLPISGGTCPLYLPSVLPLVSTSLASAFEGRVFLLSRRLLHAVCLISTRGPARFSMVAVVFVEYFAM